MTNDTLKTLTLIKILCSTAVHVQVGSVFFHPLETYLDELQLEKLGHVVVLSNAEHHSDDVLTGIT